MSDSPFTPDDIFDAKDRLQLLQLLARRQMAERLAKRAATLVDHEKLAADGRVDETGKDGIL